MVIGTIQAFNEEGNIGPAVKSLFGVGCDRVVVLDGAWRNPDGSPFGGEFWVSRDGSRAEAEAAGAEWLIPIRHANDGEKRDALIRLCGAGPADFMLLLDADERAVGSIDLERCPSRHGNVLLHNDRPDDIPELRTRYLSEQGRVVPMLRWFRWSQSLHCEAPGIYVENGRRIHPYLVSALADHSGVASDPVLAAAHRVVRDHEWDLSPAETSLLPIVPGIEIRHVIEPSPERVAAKLRYYGLEAVTA